MVSLHFVGTQISITFLGQGISACRFISHHESLGWAGGSRNTAYVSSLDSNPLPCFETRPPCRALLSGAEEFEAEASCLFVMFRRGVRHCLRLALQARVKGFLGRLMLGVWVTRCVYDPSRLSALRSYAADKDRASVEGLGLLNGEILVLAVEQVLDRHTLKKTR